MATLKKQKFTGLESFVQSMNLAQAMNECLWVGDKNHKTLYVNPVFEKTSGYSLEECIGKDCDFFFDEEGKKNIAEHHKLRSHGKSSQYEATMVSKNGKTVPLLISGAPTVKHGTIGIFTNLTELKKAQQKAITIEQTIKFSNEAIVLLDENRNILSWNAGSTKLFGYREKDVLGKNINELVVPKHLMSEVENITNQVNQKNFIRNIETQRMNKSGELIEVSISVTKVSNKDHKFLSYYVTYANISEQKRTISELQKRFEAIQDAYRELGLQQRQMDYFNDIAKAATETQSDIQSLYNLIISAICMLSKCDAATLRIYDKKNDSLDLISSLGVDMNWSSKRKIPYTNSLAEDAIKNGRPLLIDNVGNAVRHRSQRLLKMHKFSTMIILPLLVNKKIVGDIAIYARSPQSFRFIETDFLLKFARQCAIAILVKTYCK